MKCLDNVLIQSVPNILWWYIVDDTGLALISEPSLFIVPNMYNITYRDN